MPADAAEHPAVEGDPVVAPEHAVLRRAARRLLPGGPAQQLGHPVGPLDVGDRRLVVSRRAVAVDDLTERPQRDRGLAEGRQHPLDVAHEDTRGTDDEDAAGLVAPAVVVEEVRRAVQRHDRLAGARSSRDRHDALARRADRLVLLGLDGGDDGVHRPVARPRQLRHQGALADDRQLPAGRLRLGERLGVEQLVLDADDPRAGAAQHPAPDHVLRLGRRCLVEHRRGGSTPVDDERVTVLVTQADSADVPRLRVDGGRHVEATEDQALMRRIELRDPFRGLEDHRVALDEAALVAEPAPGMALLGELLGSLSGALQLLVHPVHERLLRRHLAIDQPICQRCPRCVPVQVPGAAPREQLPNSTQVAYGCCQRRRCGTTDGSGGSLRSSSARVEGTSRRLTVSIRRRSSLATAARRTELSPSCG